MALNWHLYDGSMLVGELVRASKNGVRNILDEYLREGAHPFFLLQGVQVALRFIKDPSLKQHLKFVAEERVEKRSEKLLSEVPKPTDKGVYSPTSRLYLENGKPRMTCSEGVLHGVFFEIYSQVIDECSSSLSASRWRTKWEDNLPPLLEHPLATVGLVDDINSLIISYEQLGQGGIDMSRVDFPINLTSTFFERRVKECRTIEIAKEIVETWCDARPHFFWLLWFQLLILDFNSLCPEISLPCTKLLKELLDLVKKGGRVGRGVNVFLQLHPHETVPEVTVAIAYFLTRLKDELPNTETFHAILRWLQIANSKEGGAQETLLINLVCCNSDKGPVVDPKTEYLVEELIGVEATKALWETVATKTAWKKVAPPDQLSMRRGINKSFPAYKNFQKKLQAAKLREHDWNLAKEVDLLVLNAAASEQDSEEVWEQAVDLLAGDQILSVTHLRTEWMALSRTTEDFLGDVFPVISVREHPKFKQNGAACRFSIDLPGTAGKSVIGSLDAEGKMTLDHIRVLTPRGRMAIQAAIAHTVAVLIVPGYLEMLPPRGKKGGGLLFTGELFARRPVVHTLGDLTEPIEDGPPGGRRIHPGVALMLFRWLMDEDLRCPFRLHREDIQMVGRRKEVYYPTWREAKKLLHEGSVRLSNVYFRTIRAHTRPVAASVTESGTVVFQEMSATAQRKYDFFVKDIGRELDKSSVRKTYILPGNVRVVLPVPRTFNQGTFNSLAEVWQMVPDLSLRTRAEHKFVF